MNKLIKFVTSRLTAQQNMKIANGIVLVAVILNLIDMMQNGFDLKLVPVIITLVIAAIGCAWMILFVRCSHCGDKLKGLKSKSTLPERCPNCHHRLDKLPRPKKEEAEAAEEE